MNYNIREKEIFEEAKLQEAGDTTLEIRNNYKMFWNYIDQTYFSDDIRDAYDKVEARKNSEQEPALGK
jgi:hypothetical protein